MTDLIKAYPVGTVRDRKTGKYKKISEGVWVKVTSPHTSSKAEMPLSLSQITEILKGKKQKIDKNVVEYSNGVRSQALKMKRVSGLKAPLVSKEAMYLPKGRLAVSVQAIGKDAVDLTIKSQKTGKTLLERTYRMKEEGSKSQKELYNQVKKLGFGVISDERQGDKLFSSVSDASYKVLGKDAVAKLMARKEKPKFSKKSFLDYAQDSVRADDTSTLNFGTLSRAIKGKKIDLDTAADLWVQENLENKTFEKTKSGSYVLTKGRKDLPSNWEDLRVDFVEDAKKRLAQMSKQG